MFSIGITLNWSVLDIAYSVSTTKWCFGINAEDDSVEFESEELVVSFD